MGGPGRGGAATGAIHAEKNLQSDDRVFDSRRAGIHHGAMRTLDIDWADLEIAFRDAGSESHLDTQSGEVVSIVDGFDDERDLRERLARFPGRFVRIAPVDKAWSTEVLHKFIARQRGKLKEALVEAVTGAGALSRATAVLRDDKAAWASFSRFEQSELLKCIEQFLADQQLKSEAAAPSLELFEGLS